MFGMRIVTGVVLLAALVTACSSAPAVPKPAAAARQSASTVAGFRGGRTRCADPVIGWDAAGRSRLGEHPRRVATAGYASIDSVPPGGSVGVYVSTPARWFRVRAFRMGYVDAGTDACQIWESRWFRGDVQAAGVVVGATHSPFAPWRRSLTVVTTDWTPGFYLLRIDGAGQALPGFIPLTVRSPSLAGRTVLIAPDTTWQAYNFWGEYSLYRGGRGHTFADRSRAVPFDRPYARSLGAADFIRDQLPLVVLAERLRLPLAYVTDVDLQRDPAAFLTARTIVSVGHDEYYSPTMREALTEARDHGVNIAFLGSNDVYRKIRFAATALSADRLEINYKDDTDPIAVPSLVTTQWDEAPSDDPESSLTGNAYQCSTPISYPLVVADPGNWIFAHTGVRDGTRLPGIVGQEFDGTNTALPLPRPESILFHSPATCHGRAIENGRVAWNGRATWQDSTYYTTDSGAGVWDAGAFNWTCAIARACRVHIGARASTIVSTMTTTFLLAAASGPLGRLHPAVDNVRRLYPTAPLGRQRVRW